MKTRIASVFLLAAALSVPAAAQLLTPNAAGVRPGHLHLYVTDTAAHQKFWETMGGVQVMNQKLAMTQFGGVMILFRKAEIQGGPAGSIVNHFGFAWKDLPAAMAKWKEAGYKIEQDTDPNHGFVLGPDGIRLEFIGDPSLTASVALNHIHLYPQDVAAMQAWYAKILGGVPGKCTRLRAPDGTDCVDIAGVSLAMTRSETRLVPTAGRSLDHIGFDVTNLPDFLKRMEAEGVSITQGLTASNFSTKMRVAFIADPWGTKMEVTEGIAP